MGVGVDVNVDVKVNTKGMRKSTVSEFSANPPVRVCIARGLSIPLTLITGL